MRYPYGVIDEVLARTDGEWCATWRSVMDEGELPVARWLVALAAHDVAFEEDVAKREWVDLCCSKNVRAIIHRVAAKVRPPVLAGVVKAKSAGASKKSSAAA